MREDIRNILLHPSDRKALNALTAIPAFGMAIKTFMNGFYEQQLKTINMSSKVRITPQQLPEIYELLPPICEKLDIVEPELYLELDRSPNAYAAGDTITSVTLTTGLLEYMNIDEVATVLAHECGHIACHHSLYHTMGQVILSGLADYFNFGGLLTTGLDVAFSYWERCSEFSADRAAAVCMGGATKVVDVMLRLAGGGKDLPYTINRDLFLHQAEAYEQMVNSSAWNKDWEAIILADMDHPLLTVRALEITRWCETDDFRIITEMGNQGYGAGKLTYPASQGRTDMYIQQGNATGTNTNESVFSKTINGFSGGIFSGFMGKKTTCICPSCGQNVSDQIIYCDKCGYKMR